MRLVLVLLTSAVVDEATKVRDAHPFTCELAEDELNGIYDVAFPAAIRASDNVEALLKIKLDLASERLEVFNQYLAYVYRVISPRFASFILI